MSDNLPDPIMLRLDAQGRVGIDVPCRQCGYNLHSILVDGDCPECGAPAAVSLRSDFLRFAQPQWTRKLAKGMDLLVIAILISVGLAVVGMIVGFAVGAGGGGPGNAQQLMGMVSLVPSVIAVIGYWLVTTPEPARADEPNIISSRLLARWGHVCSFALTLVQFGAVLLASAMKINQASALVNAVVGTIAMFATFMYARSLALRIPNLALASQTRIVMWGITASMGLGLLSMLIAIIALTTSGVRAGGVFAFFGCGVGISALVFGIWSLILLITYRRELRTAASLAAENWIDGAPSRTIRSAPSRMN